MTRSASFRTASVGDESSGPTMSTCGLRADSSHVRQSWPPWPPMSWSRRTQTTSYLPSYLILGRNGPEAFHVLFATDLEGDNVRVVTSVPAGPPGVAGRSQGEEAESMKCEACGAELAAITTDLPFKVREAGIVRRRVFRSCSARGVRSTCSKMRCSPASTRFCATWTERSSWRSFATPLERLSHGSTIAEQQAGAVRRGAGRSA